MASSRIAGLGLALALVPLLGGRVHLSLDQTLARAFPEAQEFRERVFEVTPEVSARVSRELGYPLPERYVVFHEARFSGRPSEYAIEMTETGKSLPMRFLVAIDRRGAVDQVILMQFLEPRGYEIERELFRRQYRGKTRSSAIRRGRDIRNISGATISVDAMNRGVKRALALYHALVPRTDHASAGAPPHDGSR
ncbi:MAG: FMN-binding protein [Myxococcota bacterium]